MVIHNDFAWSIDSEYCLFLRQFDLISTLKFIAQTPDVDFVTNVLYALGNILHQTADGRQEQKPTALHHQNQLRQRDSSKQDSSGVTRPSLARLSENIKALKNDLPIDVCQMSNNRAFAEANIAPKYRLIGLCKRLSIAGRGLLPTICKTGIALHSCCAI